MCAIHELEIDRFSFPSGSRLSPTLFRSVGQWSFREGISTCERSRLGGFLAFCSFNKSLDVIMTVVCSPTFKACDFCEHGINLFTYLDNPGSNPLINTFAKSKSKQ